jgi:Protein of unknown function (DUF2971)
MWRGYGGQGNGAALVFKTDFVTEDNPNSPLILTRVHYDSAEKRIERLNNKLLQWCKILRDSSIPDDKLHIAAYLFFHTVKFFALKSKHDGFKEETSGALSICRSEIRTASGKRSSNCIM